MIYRRASEVNGLSAVRRQENTRPRSPQTGTTAVAAPDMQRGQQGEGWAWAYPEYASAIARSSHKTPSLALLVPRAQAFARGLPTQQHSYAGGRLRVHSGSSHWATADRLQAMPIHAVHADAGLQRQEAWSRTAAVLRVARPESLCARRCLAQECRLNLSARESRPHQRCAEPPRPRGARTQPARI